MQRAYPVSLYFKSRDRHIATLMSVSIADLQLPTESKLYETYSVFENSALIISLQK